MAFGKKKEPSTEIHDGIAGWFARRAQGDGGEPAQKGALKGDPSRFKNIYESPDGRLAVFEDADGHIVCVDTDKLV